MKNNQHNILLLVEGAKTEVKLFKRVLSCFPEIGVPVENIIVYNTNIWALNNSMINTYGVDWYSSEDIDFIQHLKSSNKNIKGKITDVFLVFDYERQDPAFDGNILEKMLSFFDDSTNNGQLYINYPMIESYKHLRKPLPDQLYLNRKCDYNDLSTYKKVVGEESDFTHQHDVDRNILKQLVIHNLCKAQYIKTGKADISIETALNSLLDSDYHEVLKETLKEILKIQNSCSLDASGFVYVLCTCLLFIIDYNKNLIFNGT